MFSPVKLHSKVIAMMMTVEQTVIIDEDCDVVESSKNDYEFTLFSHGVTC